MVQVDSFIPLWEWDLPKKKGKKKRVKDGAERGKSSKRAGKETVVEASAVSDEKTVPVPRPTQSASIEEVEDDDA